jgi:Dimerisation domain
VYNDERPAFGVVGLHGPSQLRAVDQATLTRLTWRDQLMATPPAPTEGGGGVSPVLQLTQMIDGYWLSQVVHVAAKLGVADHLADGPKTSQALAQEIAADPDALYRLLWVCAGFGLLREGESQTFALAMLAGEKQALQLLAEGETLATVLTFVVRLIEAQAGDGALGSILLLDAGGQPSAPPRHGPHPRTAIPGCEPGTAERCGLPPSAGHPPVRHLQPSRWPDRPRNRGRRDRTGAERGFSVRLDAE